MKNLSADWFLEGTLDFEYKKYLLLAYLQRVSREFAEVRLYPSFSELIFQYQNLTQFQSSQNQLRERFPKRLSEEEFRKLRLVRETEVESAHELKEIESIVSYAIPQLQRGLEEGKEIYEYIDEQLNLEPIGITPLYQKEGYLFLEATRHVPIKIYEYRIIFLENTEGNFHGISLEYLDSFTYSLANTYEAMKLNLIRQHTKLPNPATWLLSSRQVFPEEASLLPVAKRKMLALMKKVG
jgi:hypothetical protein